MSSMEMKNFTPVAPDQVLPNFRLSFTQRNVSPRHGLYLPCKLAFEWLLALTLLVITLPLITVLAALVKAGSPGSAFYSQTRLGLNGKPYRIYKLRTMVAGAEARTGAVWATKGDARITPLGKVLRATHLDELPQLWNVVRGDMCLIGPRPERPEIATRVEQTLPAFNQRVGVRPGITGLAQMLLPADDPNDVGLTNLRSKLEHDLYYVREVSPLLDLRIAICTPCHFLATAIQGFGRGLLYPCADAVAKHHDFLAAGGSITRFN